MEQISEYMDLRTSYFMGRCVRLQVCSGLIDSRSWTHLRRSRGLLKYFPSATQAPTKKTPLQGYLERKLEISPPMFHQMISLQPGLAHCPMEAISSNIELIQRLLRDAPRVRSLVSTCPNILAAPLSSWYVFLTTYGFTDNQFAGLLKNVPDLFVHSSVYNAGCVILFLKSYGWTDLEVCCLLLPRLAELLQKSVKEELEPYIARLMKRGMSDDEIHDLVRHHPSRLLRGCSQVAVYAAALA